MRYYIVKDFGGKTGYVKSNDFFFRPSWITDLSDATVFEGGSEEEIRTRFQGKIRSDAMFVPAEVYEVMVS